MDQPIITEAAPVHRLYRHALESIFKFCSINELHAILAVSREWSAAVVSMASIGATHGAASMDQLSRIAGSRLCRHIVQIRGVCVYSLEGLRMLAEHHWFVWLPEHNDCVAAANTLSRLRQLKSLQVTLANSARKTDTLTIELMNEHAAAANHLIRAAACMPMLEDLSLILLCHDERILLYPLIVLTQLRALVIVTYTFHCALPSDEQIAALRAMHSLEEFEHDFTDRNRMLRLVLQAPTPPFRWATVRVASGSADVGPLLQPLSNLTELDSLQFLATDALAASLTGLTILLCEKVPSAESVHLLGLRSLRSLILFDLREPLSEAHKAQLRAVHPFVRL